MFVSYGILPTLCYIRKLLRQDPGYTSIGDVGHDGRAKVN